MKHIPIVILNKDRLGPLKELVSSLHNKGYYNIIVIDNKSTYQPLLDWYKSTQIAVFHNTIDETLYDTGTFYRLVLFHVQPFCDIIKNYYVFTDSDVVPDETVPEDFIGNMIEVLTEFNVHKVGLGLKLSDLPINEQSVRIKETEKIYWINKLNHHKYELFSAPIDTTFAVYGPRTRPLLGDGIRMGGNYIGKHIPWYYDIDNLPADELHYIKNLQPNKGPVYSMNIKQQLDGKL